MTSESAIKHALSGTLEPSTPCAYALNTLTGSVDCLTDLNALAGGGKPRVRNNER